MPRSVFSLALVLSACGSAAPPAAPGSAGAGSENERGASVASAPHADLPVDPSRRLESLSDDERHRLADWMRTNLPERSVACPDGHTDISGVSIDAGDDIAGPPPDPSAPAACRSLTVEDHVGCQAAARESQPCDAAAMMTLYAAGGPCAAFAACLGAAMGAGP